MTASDFVQKALLYQKLPTVYVWGAFGWPVTEANIQRAINAYPSSNTKRKGAMEAMLGQDAWMFDCVGYIKSLLWGFKATSGDYGGAVYGSNGVPDIDADHMISKCSGVSTDFAAITPGEVVWLSGHIGIYVGGGRVVECTPSWDNGVQVTACRNMGNISGLSGQKWTKHGKLPWVEYDVPILTQPVEPAQSQDKSCASGTVRYVANTDALSLRTGPGDAKPVICQLARDRQVMWYGYYTVVSGAKWVLVRTLDGVTGWLNARWLKK